MSQNAPDSSPIPAGHRRRLAAVLGAAATAAAIAAAVVVLTAGDGRSQSPAAAPETPLPGVPPAAVQLPGKGVTGNSAVCSAARARLGEDDVRTKVACAMAAYADRGAAATIAGLTQLPQAQPVVQVNLGLAQIWAGRRTQGIDTLRAVRESDRYGFYGTVADNVLHFPAMRPGLPLWVAPPGLPRGSVEALRAQVAADPNQGQVWLALAAKLQGPDRGQAIEDARRAQDLMPTSVTPRIAVAVLTFDKDNPAASVGALGTLTQQVPDQAISEVRFHFGMLLWWLKQDTDALAQWRQVVQAAPRSEYGRIAAKLMQQARGGQ